MPRERRNESLLPPAIINSRLLEQINDSIPDSHQGKNVTWKVGFGNDSVSEPTLSDLLEGIKDERRFDMLSLSITDTENSDHVWLLWCDSDNSTITYNVARDREGIFQSLTAEVVRLFKNHQRLRAKIPTMFRLWGFLREPRFLIGNAPEPLLEKLNWSRITEDLLSRVMAHTITLAVGFLIGIVVGPYIRVLIASVFP